ncbi:amidohydrolase [Reyranella sp.]|uniref:amidohydrolase n=1 Tax=Reyranella sp. TaxID=1929291 RepID=UPI003BA85A49
MTDRDALKDAACRAIDAQAATLFDISNRMHAEVELSFEEVKAQAWQCRALRDAGLAVEEGLGSLKTAFRATTTASKPGPRIAFLCEYDGLPVYGQSCGHNVVAAAGVGAAIGYAAVVGTVGGTGLALGTPGEEGGGGKNILHREGFFDGIDAMMLVYPGMDNIAHSRTVGATRVQVGYFGKAAHAAARPELGVNALDALLLALNGIGALRQQLPSDVRVHWIITKGGTLPQVIPDHVTAVLTVRANNAATLATVIPRIDACLAGAAQMTGAKLERTWNDRPGRELLSNAALAGRYDANMRALGLATRPRDELSGAWSGDTGNVSWFVPTIQPQMAMTARDVPPHSHEFHAASIGPAAEACILASAKAMAMTAIDLAVDPGLLAAVREEFATSNRAG